MKTARRHYFMTGATGTLGREILPRLLLADPDSRVSILVRDPIEKTGEPRIRELQAYLRYFWKRAWRSRIDVVAGDLTKPHLGLAPKMREELASRVTHVLHCAAEIDLGLSLERLRRINVDGTRSVLEFAKLCPQLQRFSYVSTAYVAGNRQGIIPEELVSAGTHFHNAYEQSKWEAEELVHRKRGSIPTLIFRPGIIVGNSSDGHLSCISGLYWPLRAIAAGQLREIPGFGDTPLDVVPVDYVAKAVVSLTRNSRRDWAIHHLTSGPERALPVAELVGWARRFFRGRASAPVHFTNRSPKTSDSQDAARWSVPTSRLARRFGVFYSYLKGRRYFDDTQTRIELAGTVAPPPSPQSYLDALFLYCEITRWGSRPLWKMTPQLEEETSWLQSA